jgi:hypothetical protein
MIKEDRNRLICVAAGCVCGLGWLSVAIASPPPKRESSSIFTVDSVRSRSVSSRLFAHPEHAPARQLDLRTPENSPQTIHRGADAALASAPFPSAIHHLDMGKTNLDTEERNQLPSLEAVGSSFRMMSPVQTLARRMRREGLPVARLWESKSALVSIGLNQKGKAGLWLTQKTR